MKDSKTFLGISGTFASGKDTVANYLVKKHQFLHVSMGDLIRQEILARGLVITREEERRVGNDLRTTFGTDVLSRLAIQQYEQSAGSYSGLVVSGIRNPAEAENLIKHGGNIIFVDADPKIRYHRLRKRKRVGVEASYGQFVINEKKELQSKQKTAQSIEDIRKLATHTIENNGTESELFAKIDKILANLGI